MTAICRTLRNKTREMINSTSEELELFTFNVGDESWRVDVRMAKRISPLFARKYNEKQWDTSTELKVNPKAFEKLYQFFTLDEVEVTVNTAVDLYGLAKEFEIDNYQIGCIQDMILSHTYLINMHKLHQKARKYMDSKMLFHTSAYILRDPFQTFKLPLTTFQFNRHLFAIDSDYDITKIQFQINIDTVLAGLEVAIPWLEASNSFEYTIIIKSEGSTIREMKLSLHSANDKGMLQFNFDAIFINPNKKYTIELVEKYIPQYDADGDELLFSYAFNERIFFHTTSVVNGCRLKVFDEDDVDKAYSRFSKLHFYPFQYRHEDL